MNIDNNKIINISVIVILVLCSLYFLYNLFASLVKPLFLDTKESAITTASLDASLDEAVEYLRQREDLTGVAPSATLTKEANTTLVAQIINGSGEGGIAKELADSLEPLGINVTDLGNATPSATTVVSLKTKALPLKEDIVAKIGSRTGEITFEDLPDTSEFDIRILIGK